MSDYISQTITVSSCLGVRSGLGGGGGLLAVANAVEADVAGVGMPLGYSQGCGLGRGRGYFKRFPAAPPHATGRMRRSSDPLHNVELRPLPDDPQRGRGACIGPWHTPSPPSPSTPPHHHIRKLFPSNNL